MGLRHIDYQVRPAVHHHPSSVRSAEVVMPTKLGFHLRVVVKFVKCVQLFRSTVRVHKGRMKADGKSVLALLILAAAWRSKLRIEVEGDDAEQAIEAIKAFFQTEPAGNATTDRRILPAGLKETGPS